MVPRLEESLLRLGTFLGLSDSLFSLGSGGANNTWLGLLWLLQVFKGLAHYLVLSTQIKTSRKKRFKYRENINEHVGSVQAMK